MSSLTRRLLLGTAVVLLGFVLLTGAAVSFSVHQRAEAATLARLQGLAYGLLGATDVDGAGRLSVREGALPDARLNTDTGGLYAELIGNVGERLWRSRSSVASVPAARAGPIGEWRLARVTLDDGRDAMQLQYQSAWALDDGQELPFLVHLVDASPSATAPLARFDRSLWAALIGAALALLLVQLGVLRAALRPLRRLRNDIDAMSRGERDALDERLPAELRPLASSVNALRSRERVRHVRARELLDDLAHNLKTPLAVLSNLPDATVKEQSRHMRLSIERYVQRASAQSSTGVLPPVAVQPIAARVASSVQRLYAERAPSIAIDIDAALTLRVPEADLYEVFGNLIDNACKYGASMIVIGHDASTATLTIDDDGPGFGDQDPDRLLARGVRSDEATDGSGLGLSSAAGLVDAWGGALQLQNRPAGGARCVIRLPRHASC